MALLCPTNWRIVLEGDADVTILDVGDKAERQPGPLDTTFLNQRAPKFRATDVSVFNRGGTQRRLPVNRVLSYPTFQNATNAMLEIQLEIATWNHSSANTATIFTYAVSGTLSETFNLFEVKVTDLSTRVYGPKRIAVDLTLEFGDIEIV